MADFEFTSVRTRVLEVMSRLCYAEPDRAIANMLFAPRELVACNGHILGRVAMSFSNQSYGIRRCDIQAVVGAAMATQTDTVTLFDLGDFIEFEIESPARLRVKKMDVSQYPPIDAVTPSAPSVGEPPPITVDPKYVSDLAELVDAVAGYRQGMKLVAWDGKLGPMLWEARGVRVVLMPMRGDGDDV